MGKYQRDWAEQVEKDTADGLNGGTISEAVAPIVDAIRAKLTELYPNDPIASAVWTGGNDYNNPGDVHVTLASGKVVKIEEKVSRDKGSGTAKNLTTRILAKQVAEDIQAYPVFEDAWRRQRFQLLESHIGRSLKNNSDYVRQLRALRDQGDSIIEQIANITHPGAEAYASYAAQEMNKHLAKVSGLADWVLHNQDAAQAKQGILYCVVKQYGSPNQTIEFYDFADMDRTVVKVESSGKSIRCFNKKGRDVIRFSVHWKNVCQGGATPCFNVFIGNAFRHN